MAEKNNDYSINCVIDRFEEKFAVLRGQNGQEFLWPIKNLPDDASAGTSVRLTISTAKTESAEQEKLAKTMLNEILKVDG